VFLVLLFFVDLYTDETRWCLILIPRPEKQDEEAPSAQIDRTQAYSLSKNTLYTRILYAGGVAVLAFTVTLIASMDTSTTLIPVIAAKRILVAEFGSVTEEKVADHTPPVSSQYQRSDVR
jgi:hypothetical protein